MTEVGDMSCRSASSESITLSRTVGDAMVTCPKALQRTATVGEARRHFDDDHVHMLLVIEGDVLLGAIVRDDMTDPRLRDDEPVLTVSGLVGRTVRPEEPAGKVHARMVASGTRRLAVVDDDGVFRGLLCLKRSHRGFCSDADVTMGAADRR
ncbi:CBS domain-containing protein [Rhodococcus pseudokoreensis]|uniref:CBS domain-containing protein n=1 Tax=Rhodococcus pseudokoreensis TaxID=2811421 RepID=A0A974W489_9NOCA|nr:CBS domain-containing protein [Rhodococcus pseudokoreensis]QSE90766.1 CBS domain-containing protein [Rhodococcus pseudokoreensis]